jgi:GH25 family lysozyme M1 (1,4-beta-N-acetylmuramidase)
VIPGLDVGVDQGPITAADWTKLREVDEYRFVLLRDAEALYATGDPTFGTNARGSRAAGFARSVYCVEHPDLAPSAQADLHFSLAAGVGTEPGDLPPAIDIELLDGRTGPQVLAATLAYGAEMAKRWGRSKVLLYSYPSFLAQMLTGASQASMSELADLTYLWLARYAGSPGITIAPWPVISLWQNSGGDKFRLPNGCPCDTDFFVLSEDAFLEFCAV